MELQEIFDHFGHEEGFQHFPILDSREAWWRLTNSETLGAVQFGKESDIKEMTYSHMQHRICTESGLPKQVYRGESLTLICVDTNSEKGIVLQVFSNAKETQRKSSMLGMFS